MNPTGAPKPASTPHAAGAAGDKRAQLVRTIREHIHYRRDDDALRELNNSVPSKLRSDPEILFLRSLVLERKRRFKEAVEFAQQSLKTHEHVDPMLLIARCYRAMGETEKALRWCDRAAKLRPNLEIIAFLRAGTLEEAGRFAEATEILEPIAKAYDESGRPYPLALGVEWSKLLVQNKRYDEAIARIDETLGKVELPGPAKAQQLYLKAKAADRNKAYDAAFASADEANGIGRLEFDPDLYEEQVSTLVENWSGKSMKDFPLADCESELPVFVAGMPRSGTSLIDQIIDAHPLAAGVGELASIEQFAMRLGNEFDADKPAPECFGRYQHKQWTRVANEYVRELKKLAPPGSERVVNKALGNNKLVGLIARLFPKTRIIHAIRDPRDVAISCFMGGFNNRMHPWTTRIEWASKAWEQSYRMMQHWKDTLDVPILEVRYERLVADPEHEFPRLIEFLGLEWDDRCFEFHKSRRTVRTLSYDQVNRPIYKTSAGRNVNYAAHIEGVAFPPYDPNAAG